MFMFKLLRPAVFWQAEAELLAFLRLRGHNILSERL